MKRRTLLLLSQGRPAEDRDRRILLAGAVALAGALLIAAGRLLQLRGYVDITHGYSNYVNEPGLRQGVVIAALLLTVPLLALAYQAVQLGSAARRRRTEQLVLAGATPAQAQAISVLQAVRAAALGATWAGPVYVVLSLCLGASLRQDHRLLPDPSALDLVSWAVVVGLCAAAAAVTDLLAGRRAASRPHWGRVVVAAAAVALTYGLLLEGRGYSQTGRTVVVVAGAGLILIAALSLGPLLLLAVVWWQQRRPGAVDLLASSRTLADLRGPGRVAAVLLLGGLVVGFETGLSTAQSGDASFYRDGTIMTTVAVGMAVFIALVTLVVGSAEQLLDASRPMASMRAFGVDAVTLRRVQQRQLASAAVPASALGLLIGSLIVRCGFQPPGPTAFLWSVALAAAGAVVIELLCVAATWTLNRRRTAATDIEHLRST